MSETAPTSTAHPLVSVVVPTYNCERYIAQTLDSVLGQSHRQIEVLVVDDGSTDSTADIVGGYGSPVRLIRQQNQGVCAARNHGFAQSGGEFVCFLDHDDYWFPWKLTRQLEAFEADPKAGVVFTDFALWFPESGVFPHPAGLASPDIGPPPIDEEFSGFIYHQFLIDCWALTSTVMIRRGAFAGSAGFDPSLPYSEDWDLWIRLSKQHRFIKLDRVSTLYRQHPEQGNRKLREIDYRTQLLESASRTWGLVSADGRRVSESKFHQNLARYHLQFALHHLGHDRRNVALDSMLKAWRNHPTRIKYLALVAAVAIGWKPRAKPSR